MSENAHRCLPNLILRIAQLMRDSREEWFANSALARGKQKCPQRGGENSLFFPVYPHAVGKRNLIVKISAMSFDTVLLFEDKFQEREW